MISLVLIFFIRILAYEYDLKLIIENSHSKMICVFVPGHRGHYLQVNSILPALVNCETFSVDFNEDISGISERVIFKQVDFLHKAIGNLVKVKQKPITLICHSMGGIIGVLVMKYQIDSIYKIITLNSPLAFSPINTHLMFPYIYTQIHHILESSQIQIISITGADDLTVPASLTQASELKSTHFYTSTLIQEQLDHNEILNSKKLIQVLKQMIESPKFTFTSNKKILDDSKVIEHEECSYKSFQDIEYGKSEVEADSWVRVKSKNDHDLIVKVQGKVFKVCRGSSRLDVKKLSIQKSEFFKLDSFQNDEFFIQVNSGKIEIFDLKYVKCKRILYKNCVFRSDRPVLLSVGNILRTPLLISSENKFEWVYTRCGNEEIVVERTDSVLIKFHEGCKNVQILVYLKDFEFEVRTPVFFMFLEFFNEFRLEIVSFGFAFLFYREVYIVIALIAYWVGGSYFRYFGFGFLDHVDFYDKQVSLGEVLALFIVSFLGSVVLDSFVAYCYKVKIGSGNGFMKNIKIWIVFMVLAPWITLVVFLKKHPKILSIFEIKLITVQFLLTLPQQVSYFYIIFIHHSIPYPTIIDAVSIFPILITTLTPSTPTPSPSSPILLSFLFILTVQDLLYRGQFILLTLPLLTLALGRSQLSSKKLST